MKKAAVVSERALLARGSDLCVECGLCCNGFLHTHAKLDSNETEIARQRALDVYPDEKEQHYNFRLPCHCHQNGKCSVYTHRPNACRGYRCRVLRRFLRQKASYEESQALIKATQQTIEEVRAYLGASNAQESIWTSIGAFIEGKDDNTDFRREHAALWMGQVKLELLREKFSPRVVNNSKP